jgi:hypothetical protein
MIVVTSAVYKFCSKREKVNIILFVSLALSFILSGVISTCPAAGETCAGGHDTK